MMVRALALLVLLQRQEGAELAAAAQMVVQMNQLYAAGQYAEAEALGERVLEIRERVLGPRHPDVAQALTKLALICQKRGQLDRTEALHRRALAIRQAALGPQHPDVADSLHNLGALYLLQAAPDRAEPLLKQALAIREKALGPLHAEVAHTLHNLALVEKTRGAYERAEPLQKRALEILEAVRGPDHPEVMSVLNNLASLYDAMGALDRAQPLFERVLKTRERLLGPSHPDVAISLNNLAALYERKNEYDRAKPLLERALAIREQALGPRHPDVAQTLVNLAGVYTSKRDFARAEPLFRRAIAIREAAAGANHPSLIGPLGNLASMYVDQGAPERALPAAERALALCEQTLGADHPQIGDLLEPLAIASVNLGRIDRATALLGRALAVFEKLARRVRTVSTEARMTAFLEQQQDMVDLVYSLAAARPADPQVSRLALQAALLRKGRSIDQAADLSRAVRHGLAAPDRARFDELRALRSRLASLTLAGSGRLAPERYREMLEKLARDAEFIEQDLAQRSAPLRAQRRLPGPDDVVARVAAELPEDGALVELVAFVRYDFPARKWGQLHYLGLLLTRDGKVGAANLGPASALDPPVSRLLSALRRPDGAVEPAAQDLERRLWRPLAPHLAGRKRLLVSPDGVLHLIPLDVLHDGTQYLIDRYALSYLTSGRDLLRADGGKSATTAVLMADPAFPPAPAPPTESALAGGLVPLPGTRQEAEAIRTLLPRARLLAGHAASEPALLGLEAPGILHVATHGLFLDDVAPAPHTRGIHLALEGAAPATSRSPLLRSALVLADAHRSAPDAHAALDADRADGFATALEVAGMNLWGTQLVVLSACDSARGEIRLGQGVYGLRRALIIAGAQTVVTSLWRLDDQVTRDLMAGYYRGLLHEKGRAEAMRLAALEVRRTHPHPYYWAPFLVIGQTEPLKLH